jgi:hypothetical protein
VVMAGPQVAPWSGSDSMRSTRENFPCWSEVAMINDYEEIGDVCGIRDGIGVIAQLDNRCRLAVWRGPLLTKYIAQKFEIRLWWGVCGVGLVKGENLGELAFTLLPMRNTSTQAARKAQSKQLRRQAYSIFSERNTSSFPWRQKLSPSAMQRKNVITAHRPPKRYFDNGILVVSSGNPSEETTQQNPNPTNHPRYRT